MLLTCTYGYDNNFNLIFDMDYTINCYVTEANEKGVDNVSDKLQSVGISGADGAPSSSQTGMRPMDACV